MSPRSDGPLETPAPSTGLGSGTSPNLPPQTGESGEDRPAPISSSLLALALWVGALISLERLAISHESDPEQVDLGGWMGLAFCLLVGGMWLFYRFKQAWRMLNSLGFGVALLLILALATALGTFILQDQGEELYERVYGEQLFFWMQRFQLTHIFHSYWFSGLFALFFLSMVLTVLRWRSYRFTEWGSMLAHAGLALLLVGGLTGRLWASKGRLELQKDRREATYSSQAYGDTQGEIKQLGFEVVLKEFKVDYHPEEVKFYLYRRAEKGWRGIESYSLEEAKKSHEAEGFRFRLLEYYPDHEAYWAVVAAAPPATGRPALKLRVEAGGKERVAHEEWLYPGNPLRESLQGPGWRVTLAPPGCSAQELEKLAQPLPERHVLSSPRSGTVDWVQEVRPGLVVEAPGYPGGLRIKNAFRDFAINLATKEPHSRTDKPANPALELETGGTGESGPKPPRFLYSKPQKAHQPKGLTLKYTYLPAEEGMQSILVLDPQQKVVLHRTADGNLKRGSLPALGAEAAFASGEAGKEAPGLALRILELQANGVEALLDRNRSTTLKNPLAILELLREGEAPRRIAVGALDKDVFPLGEACGLALEKRTQEPSNFQSRVNFERGGKVLQESLLEVNRPASFEGFVFYQADWDKERPNFSGIQVVRDPGLELVYTGMVLSFLGLVFRFYLRPWLLARQEAGRQG